MPLFMLLAIFPKPLSWQPLLYQNYFIGPKKEPRFIPETKLLSKLSIYKIIGTLIRLKRICNFLCSMLISTPFALCFITLHGVFMQFLELTY
jgi:hypothetical protein